MINPNSSVCIFREYLGYIDHIVGDYESTLKNKYVELTKVKALAQSKFECRKNYKKEVKGFNRRVDSMSTENVRLKSKLEKVEDTQHRQNN